MPEESLHNAFPSVIGRLTHSGARSHSGYIGVWLPVSHFYRFLFDKSFKATVLCSFKACLQGRTDCHSMPQAEITRIPELAFGWGFTAFFVLRYHRLVTASTESTVETFSAFSAKLSFIIK
ncbi:hypothetical protein ACKU5B_028015 [Klebsiella pneumoniae]